MLYMIYCIAYIYYSFRCSNDWNIADINSRLGVQQLDLRKLLGVSKYSTS